MVKRSTPLCNASLKHMHMETNNSQAAWKH